MNTCKPVKYCLWLAVMLMATQLHAQSATELLEQGKDAFKNEFKKMDEPGAALDFSEAVQLLEKAVKADPQNQEAHYFLGYAYDKSNAAYGDNMLQMNPANTIKISNEFEQVIRIAPAYTGEKLVLDPYSKITATWGSQAMVYWSRSQPDSAKWALQQGRKRGGFGNLTLMTTRKSLESCDKNAILFSFGDIPTLTLLYLQQLENIRPDVTVMDMGMLHTAWYSMIIYRRNPELFGMSADSLQNLSYREWRDSLITIPYGKTGRKLKWVLKPNYGYQYLLRGDRVLLDILQKNRFARPVYMLQPLPEDYGLSLESFLKDQFYYSRIVADPGKSYDDETCRNAQNFPLDSIATVNRNCTEEMNIVTTIRGKMLMAITALVQNGKTTEARHLLGMLKAKIPEADFPYPDEKYAPYIEELEKKLAQ